VTFPAISERDKPPHIRYSLAIKVHFVRLVFLPQTREAPGGGALPGTLMRLYVHERHPARRRTRHASRSLASSRSLLPWRSPGVVGNAFNSPWSAYFSGSCRKSSRMSWGTCARSQPAAKATTSRQPTAGRQGGIPETDGDGNRTGGSGGAGAERWGWPDVVVR